MGRYELQFTVSDRVWAQTGVRANVTVEVRLLIPDALAHAASVTLAPTTPADLTRGWTPGVRKQYFFITNMRVITIRMVNITVIAFAFSSPRKAAVAWAG